MKNRIACVTLVMAVLFIATSLRAQPAPRPRVSPHETISTIIQGDYLSGSRVIVVYGRPYSKDPRGNTIRKIWGEVVPFDKVWRTGADEATLLITPLPLEMGGMSIPAGIYTLYTLPKADGSAQLIINKEFGQWGLKYDEKQDLARIDLKRDNLDQQVDQFTMAFTGNAQNGFVLKMSWEKVQYSVPFTVKK